MCSFNAARGFVGGAAWCESIETQGFLGFQCRTRLCGLCNATLLKERGSSLTFQCRTRLCGWCSPVFSNNEVRAFVFQCRTRLFPFAPTTASRSPSPARAGEAFRLRHVSFSPRHAGLGCCKVPSQREGLRYFSFPHHYGGSGERSEPIGAPMPHAALWVVQLDGQWSDLYCARRFNAARGFVGGAADLGRVASDFKISFQCRTRLCGWCSPKSRKKSTDSLKCFNAARGFVGGAAAELRLDQGAQDVSMPHAALWVVQQTGIGLAQPPTCVSMPHAALWVVQRSCCRCHAEWSAVSMPHAALWVVQLQVDEADCSRCLLFQCRTRLCGWCSKYVRRRLHHLFEFQCRTRLCGWCSAV